MRDAEGAEVDDLLPDGVCVADADGVVTRLNAEAARLLGVSREDVLGRPLDEVLTLVDSGGVTWADYNRPYEGPEIRTGLPEQSWLLPDGREVLTVARLHRAVHLGPVTGVAVSLRSARGRARLDRDRSDLVATVAHELRSPLSGVKGFAQALLQRWDRLTDDQRKLMLETIHADADRLARLIVELLDVARLDTGRLMLATRPVDLGMLATRVVDSVAAATSRPILLDVADRLPAAEADPDKFTQVLTNLVENAVRHGRGDVRVSLAASPSGRIIVAVEDDGDGIPESLRSRVFTKFWSSGSGSSGLGLFIVSGITRAHGGSVSVSDAASGGARLELDWPAAADHD